MLKVKEFFTNEYLTEIFDDITLTQYGESYWFEEFNNVKWINTIYDSYYSVYYDWYIVCNNQTIYKRLLKNLLIEYLPLLYDLQLRFKNEASKEYWANKDPKQVTSSNQKLGVNSDNATPNFNEENYGNKSITIGDITQEDNRYIENVLKITTSALPQLLLSWLENFSGLHYLFYKEKNCY